MPDEPVSRMLTAILYADVADYSRLTEADEIGTHRQLAASLDLIAERVGNAGGRIVHYAGDAVLASFVSVVAATSCALGIQGAMAALGADVPDDYRLRYRIGINLGEVIVDRDDIYGDGVNVAARLESLAPPGGIFLSEAAFEQVREKLDAVFEDMGEHRVKNIARPVRAYRVAERGDGSGESRAALARVNGHYAVVAAPAKESTLAERFAERQPSIMILPFANLTGDASRDPIVNGFRLAIQSAMVKLPGLFLVNVPVAEIYRDRSVTGAQAGNEVGIRYVLEGAVQSAGDRIRLTVRLTDAPAAVIVWSETYDRVIDDIFEVQDEITTEIVVALDIKLFLEEEGVSFWSGMPSRAARECALRALSHIYAGTPQDNALARRAFEELVQLMPGDGKALALLAATHWLEAMRGWSDDFNASMERAAEIATEAVELGDPDAFGHTVLAYQRLHQGRHDEALALSRAAVGIRRSCPMANAIRSEVLNFCGEPDEAIVSIRRAIRHARLYPPWMANILSTSYRDCGMIDSSISVANAALKIDPENVDGRVLLCTDYAAASALDDARRVAREILRIDPSFSIGRYLDGQPYREEARREAITAALREAGLPD